MKFFGLISVLTLLVSCGGGSSSKSDKATSNRFDATAVDKYEEHIRSLRPGMVTETRGISSDYILLEDQESGKFVPHILNEEEITTETILKIEGDKLYMLTEYSDSRVVRVESISANIADLSAPSKRGEEVEYTRKNNTLIVKSFHSSEEELERSDGQKVRETEKESYVYTVDLNNIRCSGDTERTNTISFTQDGKTVNLPATNSKSKKSCAKTLTAKQLKSIDLSKVSFCDNTNPESEEDTCSYDVDMSDLL